MSRKYLFTKIAIMLSLFRRSLETWSYFWYNSICCKILTYASDYVYIYLIITRMALSIAIWPLKFKILRNLKSNCSFNIYLGNHLWILKLQSLIEYVCIRGFAPTFYRPLGAIEWWEEVGVRPSIFNFVFFFYKRMLLGG